MTPALLLLSAAFAATDIKLTTSDGVALHAVSQVSPGAKRGVVFVHQEGRNAEDWRFLLDRVSKAQFTSVAPDLRGHGGSTATITDADYPKMIEDLRASTAWLRKQGVNEVTCVGAGVGANLCAQAAASDPNMVNLVLLSAGMNIKGVTAGDAVQRYGDRPILIVASNDDAQARATANVLNNVAVGQKQLEMMPGSARGTKMLNDNASLEGLILSWVAGTYTLSGGELVHPKPSSADPGSVQTTGKSLGGN